VPHFEEIKYRNIYDGVDIRFYWNGKSLEYDIIVSENSDHSNVQLSYTGVDSLHLTSHGFLTQFTPIGTITEHLKKIYFIENNVETAVLGDFTLYSDNTVGFELKDNRTEGMSLVIFAILPTLAYYYTVYQLGSPPGNLDSGAIAGSYIGLVFLAGAFVAIGVFASS